MTTWHEYFRDEGYRIALERTDTEHGTMRRIVVGDPECAGAVALVSDGEGRILLVQQERLAIGETLWELPRGLSEPSDANAVETAQRELREETGITAGEGNFCGWVYPDSGILASRVGVVLFQLPDAEDLGGDTDGEVQDARWFTLDTVNRLIADGRLRDAISLAALRVAGI